MELVRVEQRASRYLFNFVTQLPLTGYYANQGHERPDCSEGTQAEVRALHVDVQASHIDLQALHIDA